MDDRGGSPDEDEIRSVELSEGVRDAVVRAAQAAGAEEACGLLIGRRRGQAVGVMRAVECRNIAPEPDRRRRFEIDPRVVMEEERRARSEDATVVGFYHSHPASDPIPSGVDRRYMGLWPDSVWLIVGPWRDGGSTELRAWKAGLEPDEIPAEVAVKGGGEGRPYGTAGRSSYARTRNRG